MNRHSLSLNSQNAKHPMRRTIIKTSTISQSNMQEVKVNMYTWQIPRRIVVGLLGSVAYHGKFKVWSTWKIPTSNTCVRPKNDRLIDITRKDYPNGYSLFIIPFSSSEPHSVAFDLIRRGTLRLEMKIAEASTTPATITFLRKYDSVLQITKDDEDVLDHLSWTQRKFVQFYRSHWKSNFCGDWAPNELHN